MKKKQKVIKVDKNNLTHTHIKDLISQEPYESLSLGQLKIVSEIINDLICAKEANVIRMRNDINSLIKDYEVNSDSIELFTRFEELMKNYQGVI